MATVVTEETVEAVVTGSGVRYLFHYVLSTGETHERRAWAPVATDELTERALRGTKCLEELEAAEIEQLFGVDE